MKIFEEIDALIKAKMDNDKEEIFPVLDGIVNDKEYSKAKYEILWILKEPHDKGGGDWDMRKFLRDKRKLMKYPKWQSTFSNIIYVTYSILNDFKCWDDMDDIADKPEMIDILKKIAFINLKKIPGESTSVHSVIKKAYDAHKGIILQQIHLCNPNVIICGGTMSIISKDLGIDKLIDKNGIKYYATENKIYIDTYHPNQRGSQKEYCNSIIGIVRDWSQKK
ncbi:hypothetical protein CYCD_13530 [Tenuifilaceae bacterium CYCD]|nr:hypothetical protein CYCD_13530 [Tenuifilaceae bacterium CYCD]